MVNAGCTQCPEKRPEHNGARNLCPFQYAIIILSRLHSRNNNRFQLILAFRLLPFGQCEQQVRADENKEQLVANAREHDWRFG